MSRASTRRGAVRSAGAAAAGAVLAAGPVRPAAAHHSYPANYDTTQSVSVNGVVQLVRFSNPHVHIVIEAALEPPPAAAAPSGAAPAAEGGAEGAPEGPVASVPVGARAAAPETTLWVLDLPAPNRAQGLGLTPEALPPGTPLSVVAWPPRASGSHDLAPLSITFDGSGQTVYIR